ncbi:hypothetical protein CsSME_00049387 [Camellia sinensis var. sinensis]
MSKMKHLFRRLHIGSGFNDHHHHHHHHRRHPSPPPTAPPPAPSLADSSSSSSSSAALVTTRAVDSVEKSVDVSFFEEDFQVQLALAMSVSDPDAREDPETAQIKAAKQISLGCAPSETLVEFLSLRYWVCFNPVFYSCFRCIY